MQTSVQCLCSLYNTSQNKEKWNSNRSGSQVGYDGNGCVFKHVKWSTWCRCVCVCVCRGSNVRISRLIPIKFQSLLFSVCLLYRVAAWLLKPISELFLSSVGKWLECWQLAEQQRRMVQGGRCVASDEKSSFESSFSQVTWREKEGWGQGCRQKAGGPRIKHLVHKVWCFLRYLTEGKNFGSYVLQGLM